MKTKSILILYILSLLLLSGCTAVNNLSKGIAEKSVTGSGTIAISRAGLDKTSQTPELFNLLVVGDYTSIADGDELLRMEYSEDASIFNSGAISKNFKLIFSSSDKKRVDQVISELQKNIQPLLKEKTP